MAVFRSNYRWIMSKMSEDGAHTMPKRTRKESVLGPVSKIVPHLRKQSTILPPLPTQDIQVLEKLMYEYDPRTRTDEGILRLCKEIKEKWSGTMTPPQQYGLNDAWNKINQAESMKVEFAIRSNVTFNGLHDDDSPIHGKAVTFRARDCLHIKAQFNEDWWIGRVVKCDAPIGFVPTPMKLKKLVSETLNQQINNKDTNTLKKTHSFDKEQKKVTSSQEVSDKLDGSTENISHIAQTRISEKDLKAQGPYEAIPLIRPIVLCGPSLRNFDVTDLMHKALFHALKRAFGDKLEVVHIEEKWLKPFHNALANKHLVGTTEAMDHVMHQVFTASQSFKLLFIDLKVNSPTALKRSPLAPLLVHIKIANMKILQNLIKSRGADQKRSSAAQVYTAQKLCDLDKRVFDVVLKECNFEDAADHLIRYLNKYYEASRPTQAPKRSDQLLRSSLNPSMMKGLVVKSPFGSRRNNSKREKERHQLDSPRGNEIVAKG
ncbi:hypothetical protein ACHWQZ_G018060 [Mnemiopsis leidyi]